MLLDHSARSSRQWSKRNVGRDGTPFSRLQFMAQSVPSPQIVTMLGKGTRPLTGHPHLNIQFPHLQFCTSTTASSRRFSCLPRRRHPSFQTRKWLVATTSSTWNFGRNWPCLSENADYQWIFARSASASKKVPLTLIRAFQRAYNEHQRPVWDGEVRRDVWPTYFTVLDGEAFSLCHTLDRAQRPANSCH